MRKRGLAVSMTISEPFLRDHQVLPGRTHPVMTTEANSGGYILSGTHVRKNKKNNSRISDVKATGEEKIEVDIEEKRNGDDGDDDDDSENRESKKPRCE
jgi:tRNA (adenine-N(1)-)-methyltransferase non-catalytic subunit